MTTIYTTQRQPKYYHRWQPLPDFPGHGQGEEELEQSFNPEPTNYEAYYDPFPPTWEEAPQPEPDLVWVGEQEMALEQWETAVTYYPPPASQPAGFVALAGGLLLLLFAFTILNNLRQSFAPESAAASNLAQTATELTLEQSLNAMSGPAAADGTDKGTTTQLSPPAVSDPTAFVAPYDDYVLTQGLHGYSYGHMAIDIAAGKGALIKSPINGWVSDKYIDQYNNTTLVLENERYKVLFLHGNYTVEVGQTVTIGQPIGTESNKGYTLDRNGRLCTGRDCGYHTHLNVYDKKLGANINPLELLK